MPELPETETIAGDLDRLISGLMIEGARVRREDVLRHVSPAQLERRVAGRSVRRVHRRAKTVCVTLDSDDRLLVTPRFTGALLFDVADDAYTCLSFQLSGGHTIAYRDVRRLGTVTLVDAEGYRAFDESLGIEPLDVAFTGDALSGIVRALASPIKKVLMDQRRIAGVGNIYANEGLWLAGIDPSRSASSLSRGECETLATELRGVLVASVAARGTTFRDYRDATGGRGGFASALRCYGRGGEPCTRCGTKLTESQAVDGRSTVFCHRCQH